MLARAERLAVLIDLDGTLIEFAPTPEEARLDPEGARLLEALVATGVRVVVVSGRPRALIDSLRPLVPGAWWVAEHGSWRWDPELSQHPLSESSELESLVRMLAPVLDAAGVRVERKSLSVCVHWRQVSPSAQIELAAALEVICDEWLEEHHTFERIGGVQMLEVRQRAVHKGTVVNWVRDRSPGTRIITIGDDLTDEDMFAELDDGDASVSVGPLCLQADAYAKDIGTTRAFIDWVASTRLGQDRELPISPAINSRKRHRLLVMSNRTPAPPQGRTKEVGGLISALEPALRDEHGIWLGWSGQTRGHDSRVVIDATEQPARARFDLPASVREQFYAGFCNSVLWPLFHGFPQRVNSTDGAWAAYVQANERFARHAMELTWRSATIWVHDYHLLLAARALRFYGHQGPIGLFLHIPFPSPEVLNSIPWGKEIASAMCEFDLVGFQTQHAATNFLASANRVERTKPLPAVGVFPATIDPKIYQEPTEEVREVAGLRTALGDRRLILGVDRLDYSKGIPERLAAYERFLDRYPEWRRRVSLLQVSVPTRAEIPDYAELRERVEGMVGRINGYFGDTDWVPVRYLYRSYDQHVLAQLYRLADVALVTPLRDGMNLVAKEFVVSQDPATPGVLVLSQYAGAAETLASALITNPFHPEGLAADLDHALRMPQAERIQRHRVMLGALEAEGDARAWAQRFLDTLAPRRLHTVD